MGENGYFPDGVNSLSEDDGQAKQLMYQETAGMLLCGSWYTGTFATDSEEFYEKSDGSHSLQSKVLRQTHPL